jgi:coenzyme F420-reducing hydrogenase beta subunit
MPKLAEFDRCTGCTACAAVCPKGCISMQPDADGFCHPVIDESSCIGCGLCKKVCPVLHPVTLEHTPTAWAAESRDEASRLKSTSGGVFPELAKDILERGGAVFGAAYDENFRVIHICAEGTGELDRLRGAKYAQSDMSDIFVDVKSRLDVGQQVLFSGTPCQVLGLKTYLRKDYANLLTVDLVCHSVPSPLAWEKYLEYISGGKTITAVNLRSKDTGWSRYRYCNRFDYADGSNRTDGSGQSLYMKLFVGGYITRPSCANCPAKGYARVSDLTLGDFWGIWDIRPELDDDRGVSLVMAQTEKGLTALKRLEKWPVTLEEASRENSAIIHTAPRNPMYNEVMNLVRRSEIAEAARLLPIAPQKKRSFLRKAWHILKRKLRCR